MWRAQGRVVSSLERVVRAVRSGRGKSARPRGLTSVGELGLAGAAPVAGGLVKSCQETAWSPGDLSRDIPRG